MASIKKSEIKPCVIQFLEVRGFEKIVDSLEPEEYADIIKDITKIYDEVIGLYEGHVDKHDAKVFMATFGVPISHEEDPERAIKSALLLRKRMEEYNTEHNMALTIKVGINLGKVYAGDVGSEIKKKYTVMGEAVNFAARIMERAQESQILVGEEVHRITEPVFQFSEPIEFQPQGSQDKIKVFDVSGQRSGFIRRRGIEGLKSPLIGRTETFNVLKEFLKKLLDGKGSLVTIIGEAGVGKSRLIEELFTYSLSIALEQAKAVNWCSGYCSPYKETIYLPFIEITRQICGIDSDDSEKTTTEKLIKQIDQLTKDQADEIYPYIANLLNIKLDSRYDAKIKYLEPKAIKLQTHVAIATLLKNYALQEPCVYIIDDLYLADVSTLEALKFFLETKKEIPMLIFLLSRPEKERPFWKYHEGLKQNLTIHEIDLRRLTVDETKKISENLLKIPKLPASIMDDVVAKADGNPFFLEEIIKLLIAEGILYRKGSEWHATDSNIKFTMPYSIEAIIRNRFDTMDTTLRSTLEEMAVAGRNFSKKILEAFSSQWENLDDLMQNIADLGFISTNNDEDFSFNHALVRDVIYSSIPEKRKKNLHLKIAETIEVLFKDRLPEFHEILFEHFGQTEEHEKTVEYGLKAAENAKKRYANHEAIQYFFAIREELNHLKNKQDLETEVLKELGEIHSLIGKNEEAFELFNQASKLCKSTKQEADILKSIADIYEKTGDFKQAIETYNEALSKISDAPEIEKAWIKTGIAFINYLKGDYEKSREMLEQTLANIGDSTNIKARKIQAKIYDRLGTAYYFCIGKRQDSIKYYNKALKLYEILDDINGQGIIYNNLCDFYIDQGDYYSSLSSLQKSLEIDLKTGNLHGQAIVIYNFGDVYFQLGEFELAQENFEKSLKIYEQTNNRFGIGLVDGGLGGLYLEKNQFKKSEQHFTKALSILSEVGTKKWQIIIMSNIAELFLMQIEYEKSWQLCENIMLMAEKINDYDRMNDIKIIQAKIRIEQALKKKKLAVTYLQDAKANLTEVNETIEQFGTGAETKFEIYSNLCRVHYYLGMPKETIEFYKRAKDIIKETLKFIKDKEAQKKFLSRRMYRKFEEFRQQVKL